MDTFLSVPIRVRGEVFGKLYLCESSSGAFTAEDEDLRLCRDEFGPAMLGTSANGRCPGTGTP